MTHVRCPCGTQYSVPDSKIGQRVRCAKCEQVFVATPVGVAPRKAPKARPAPPPRSAPPAPKAPAGGRMRLGEMAIARGWITHEQLSACLSYQRAMSKIPGEARQGLGEILVGKRLLTRAQLEELLAEQQSASVRAAVADFERPGRRGPATPVSDEQREAIRRSVEAAQRQEAERQAAAAPARPTILSRVRKVHVTIAVAVLAAVVLAMVLWPAPAAKRVLVAYLKSSDEAATAPDASLALRDLGLAVREFDDPVLLRRTRYDYEGELGKFKAESGDGWEDLLAKVPMPDEKRRALEWLLPALPEELGPRSIGGLQVVEQAASCRLVFRLRGMGMYSSGVYRFILLRAKSPAWSCDWKVAGYEPLSIAAK